MPRTTDKKPLSQERILRAAVKHADKHGIASLNMRTLAEQLDAGAMSIYHYFASKDELLDAMVEWVATRIHLPTAEPDWRDALTEIATSTHHNFLKHPWINGIWWKRKPGPNKLAYMESILRVLRESGFSIALACDAYHAITAHVEGFTLQTLEFPVKAKDLESAASGFLKTVEDPQSIPYFIEHVQHHLDRPESSDQFGLMLQMILDGFEARLNEV